MTLKGDFMEFKNRPTTFKGLDKKETVSPPASEKCAPAGKVTVICGIHKLPDLAIAGMTVEKVRQDLTTALNIKANMASVVNGKNVDNKYVLKANETLEFVRHAGSKG
jgi:hypothetical protein